MPRKRRAHKARRGPARLSELPFEAELCFVLGWAPGAAQTAVSWATWAEFLSAYLAVREELLDDYAGHEDPFAERVVTFAADRGTDALEAASYADVLAHSPAVRHTE